LHFFYYCTIVLFLSIAPGKNGHVRTLRRLFYCFVHQSLPKRLGIILVRVSADWPSEESVILFQLV
jgi:hypothetical protein